MRRSEPPSVSVSDELMGSISSEDDWEAAVDRLVIQDEEEDEDQAIVEQRARQEALKEKGRALRKASIEKEAEHFLLEAELAKKELAEKKELDFQSRLEEWKNEVESDWTSSKCEANNRTQGLQAELFQVQ